ncbi:hypothetical protein A605_10490 [Corynebacterium halotolerans YIM 70093 = DSM 44683]|uniref:Uncharacterized protein n=1 Tax=Corynebacterium halotolerans YIM 70093 = DSM 44683 TaxID=1121362 RepID=M1NP20_9CORY|nr:hypothetical protein A605_10490 [Corynebacterium halotolerans YIM 70093 = DSM 44683]
MLTGGAGSALTVLNSYAEQIDWLGQALGASYRALTGQNAFVERGMEIADEGGVIGDDAVSFPTRPTPRFENFSFTPPMITPALSINQLSADFTATKIAESVLASETWKQLSADISSIAQGLHSVSQGLAGSNGGDVIDAAVEKISEVAQAGETFAQNSAVMGQSVEKLAAIKSQGAHQVNMARVALATIQDPVARAAAEQSFLASFPATFTPSVLTGMPPIRNLMSMEGGAGGGGEVALGMTDVEGTGDKHDASGLRAPGTGAVTDALGALRQAGTAGQFSAVDSRTADLASVGGAAPVPEAALRPGEIATSAANAGTSLPNISPLTGAGVTGSGTGLGTGAAPGIPAGVGIGGSGTGTGGAGGAGGAATPVVGPMAPMGARSPLGGTSAAATTGIGAVPGAPVGRAAAPGMPVSPVGRGVSGGVAGAGVGAGVGTGVGGRAGVPAAGGGVPGAVPNPGAGAGASSQPAAGAGPRGGVAGTAPAGARGMMPMMGAPLAGAGQQSKSAKVRTVTSTVEEDTNVAALLGDRGPVVPGVIGAWARG